MAVILTPDRWRRQPGGGVEPESYCTFAYNPAYSGPGLTACRGIPGEFILTPDARNRWFSYYSGMRALHTQDFYGGDAGVAFPSAGALLSNARGWLLVFGSLITNATANYQRLVDTTAGFTIRKDAASITRVTIGGSAWDAPLSWGDILNGKPTVFTWGPTGRQIWNGGTLLASTTAVPGATGISGTLSVCANDNHKIEHFLLAGGVSAPMSAADLSANPWQIFRKQPRILYFTSAGGGGATITGDSGSYTLTGTAATLKVGRKLTADSGTYSLTGTDVAFKRGYALSAESGTYTVSGTAVDLKAGRKLTADSGSYAITGTDVSLKLGRKLTAESGTYTVNGTDVSLTAGRKLTADSGTYALTGTDVTLTYQPAGGYTLALDSGSYTLTGTAATLKASRKLTADSGTYALTGTDVTLTRGFKITADSGTYTLTGSNVAFARTYRLPADSGSYALSGSPVSLSWSGEVVPVAPTHGGPSIYGKAVFREAEFKREYEREVSRIENERIRAIQMREDEEIVIIMAALAA